MAYEVLLAFDKFKDAISAERACEVVSRELRQARPEWRVRTAPLTDGGEGFCRILTRAAGGDLVRVPATGPRLEPMEAEIGLVPSERLPPDAAGLLFPSDQPRPERLAVIEMAAVSGLALVPAAERNPWRTTSFGTGQLLRAAAEMHAGFIVLGVGGSATSDLGLGALSALGLEFRDGAGQKIRPPFPETWERIDRIEGAVFESLPPIAIACDVTNPLLGPAGAAAIYGPQKGLRAEDLPRLDTLAERLARKLCDCCGIAAESALVEPGAGAAGGISFGLRTAAQARLVPGFELVTHWLDLEARLTAADLVITGEGRFDRTSLGGKGPGALVDRVRAKGGAAMVFAGAVEAGLADAHTIQISPPDLPLPRALAETEQNLATAVNEWLAAAESDGV